MKNSLVIILFVQFAYSFSSLYQRKLKGKKEKESSEQCSRVYELSSKYSSDESVKKYSVVETIKNDENTSIFPTIEMDFSTTIFEYEFNIQNNPKKKEIEVLFDFFERNGFPNMINWGDITSCCLISGNLNGKKIFDEICYPLMFSLVKLRYKIMIDYFDRAFQEAFQNQEYVIGEIPLTDEQKKQRAEERKRNPLKKAFSIYLQKASHPIFIYKGGQKLIIDEDNYDFPNENFLARESTFINKLKERLSRGCSIVFFVPIDCSNFVRICSIERNTINWLSTIANSSNLTQKTEESIETRRKKCTERGFEMYCVSREIFIENVFPSEVKIVNKISNYGNVPPVILTKGIEVKFPLFFQVREMINMKIRSFQKNLVQNIHLQRMIFDNFNQRYSNDRMIIENEKNCKTFIDCLGIRTTLSAFNDAKFQENELTGIEDIDNIFATLSLQKKEFIREKVLTSSLSLGNYPAIEFWKSIKESQQGNFYEIENNINLDKGFVSWEDEFLYEKEFYYPLIQPAFEHLIMTEFNLKEYKSDPPLSASIIENLAVNIISELRNLKTSIYENLEDINKIIHSLSNEIGLYDKTTPFDKSVKMNEAYSLLTLDSLEEITHIQPDFAASSETLRKFILKTGVSLVFARERLFSVGGRERDKGSTLFCNDLLETSFISFAQSLKLYAENYQDTITDGKKYSKYRHFDSLYNLAYFMVNGFRSSSACYLHNKKMRVNILSLELSESGFYDDDINIFDNSDIENYKGPTFSKEFQQMTDPSIQEIKKIFNNFQVLYDYSLAILGRMGKTNDTLIEKVIKYETMYFQFFHGYKVGNKTNNLIEITKLFSYMLTSMTINFVIHRSVWKFYAKEQLPNIKIDSSKKGNIARPSLLGPSKNWTKKLRLKKKSHNNTLNLTTLILRQTILQKQKKKNKKSK